MQLHIAQSILGQPQEPELTPSCSTRNLAEFYQTKLHDRYYIVRGQVLVAFCFEINHRKIVYGPERGAGVGKYGAHGGGSIWLHDTCSAVFQVVDFLDGELLL